MPSIKVYPTLSGGYSNFEYYLHVKGVEKHNPYGATNIINERITNKLLGEFAGLSYFLSDPLNFNYNEDLYNLIPENTFLTSIDFNLYIKDGRNGETLNFTLENASKNLLISPGWKKITFSGGEVSALKEQKTTKLSFSPTKLARIESPSFLKSERVIGFWADGIPLYERIYERPISDALQIYNHASTSYAPYITVNYSFYPPVAPDNLNPVGVTVNPRVPIRFSWNSTIEQVKFELQYKVNGGDWSTITEETSSRFYDLPGNTIAEQSGNVDWQVRVAEASGTFSEFVKGSFVLGTVPQAPPRIIKPAGDYIKVGTPIEFEWDFISNTIETQKAYEIELKLLNETKILSGTSEITKHTENLNVTDSLVAYWKLRVQNNFDEWSDWTESVSFQTMGIPPAPQIISIENNNRPLITWNSREQEAYQIEIVDTKGNTVFQTNKILGVTEREYKVPVVLENGKYIFKLTITNAYGIDSETTEFTHIIEPEPIEAPEIYLFKSDFFVEVSSTSLDGEVLRDGKIIGNLNKGKFRDYTGANYKTYSYQIRVFENDIAGLSEKVGGVTEFGEINTLATIDDLANYFKISYGLDEPITKTIDYSVQGTEVQLEGRKYPFVEFSSHSTAGFSLSFYVETLEQVKELKSLVDQRKEFLLRESRGKNIQGVLYGFNAEYHNLGYKISCTMTITGEDYD